MRCGQVRRLLVPLEDDEIQPALAEKVREHLEGCPACAARARRLAATRPVPPERPALDPAFWGPMHEAILSAYDASSLDRVAMSEHGGRSRARAIAAAMAWAALVALAIHQAIQWQAGEPLAPAERSTEADILPADLRVVTPPAIPASPDAAPPGAIPVQAVSYTPHYGTF